MHNAGSSTSLSKLQSLSLFFLDTGSAPVCLSCQNPSLNPSTESVRSFISPSLSLSSFRIITGLQLNTTVEASSDDSELDHRLHFQVATEHFTHNNEQIKFHFKVNLPLPKHAHSFRPSLQCFVVRSTTNKHFIAQTILTDFGIYIFQQDP